MEVLSFGASKRKQAHIRQTQIYHDYYCRLKNIAMTVFEWQGLPESCNARFLENCLFHDGQAVFFFDSDLGWLNLKCTPSGELNCYNEPVKLTAYGTGYEPKELNPENCVRIWNNEMLRPTEQTVILYAERLALLEMAIRVNINAQKTPILLRCDDKTRKSLEVIYSQYDGNAPVILGSKDALLQNPLEAIVTGAPFVADKLREEKTAVWNEAMEFLGINTNPSDKKRERVFTAEINSNNEQIMNQSETFLHCRQRAAAAMSELSGFDITVERRVKPAQPAENGEGVKNG